MNKGIISKWNEVVGEEDEVYVVGDVSFTGEEQTAAMLQSMHGKKYLVAGNHDAKMRKQQQFFNCFAWIKDYYELAVPDSDIDGGNQNIVLCHFPMLVWNRSRYGSWMIHGHCHGRLMNHQQTVRRYDVGVDPNNFYPVSYEKLKVILNKKDCFDIK